MRLDDGMETGCPPERRMETEGLVANFCPSCLGREMLTVGCDGLACDPKNAHARYLAAVGALLSRRACERQEVCLPKDAAAWHVGLSPATAPHLERILETLVDLVATQAVRRWEAAQAGDTPPGRGQAREATCASFDGERDLNTAQQCAAHALMVWLQG